MERRSVAHVFTPIQGLVDHVGTPQTVIQAARRLLEALVGLAVDEDARFVGARGLESLLLAEPHHIRHHGVLGLRAFEPRVCVCALIDDLCDQLGDEL